MKNKKGITLIALIITIIILLILAGISISVLFGEDGIINKTEIAKINHEIATYKDRIEIAKGGTITEKLGKLTLDNWISQIYKEKIVPEGNIVKQNEEKAIVTTIEGYVFKIYVKEGIGYITNYEIPQLQDGDIIIENPIWDPREHTASTTIRKGNTVDSTFKVQYQVVTNENELTETGWTDGTNVSGLILNSYVYARLYDGVNELIKTSLQITDSTAPQPATISLSTSNITTATTLTATVELTDNESGVDVKNSKYEFTTSSDSIGVNSDNYSNSFASNPQELTLGSETSGTYYLHILTTDNAGNSVETISSAITCKDVIPKTQSYVGCYADIDCDTIVDGIIYADLAIGGSGKWYDSEGTYSYSAITGTKNYYVSTESYDGSFGEKPVLTATGTGEDRFYVMALEDISTSNYWYYNASTYTASFDNVTSTKFGTGKTNTNTMIAKWDAKTYGKQNSKDIWGVIKDKVTEGWFVPSKGEWAAFGNNLKITSDGEKYKLSSQIWSSSYRSDTTVWYAKFGSYYGLANQYMTSKLNVRLSTTF